MHVITIETPSLGDRSYVVHDGTDALVVDPQRDLDRVVAEVEQAGVQVRCIVETHLHNDYVSGGLTLARITGARYVHAADEDLPFEHVAVAGGDELTVGSLHVEVVHTPGHTPHHLSYVVHDGDEPPAAFTGGSLLYGSVGRTDLIGDDVTDELTRHQYHSARKLAERLPDEARIYPTHGFGSFCSSAGGEGESDGTLRTEREVNLALTVDDEDDFVQRLVEGLSSYPRYYAYVGPRNRAGGGPVDLSPAEPVDAAELARRIHRGEWVVDLRDRKAFAAEHLAGTVGIELDDPWSTYLGWLMPWGTPVTLLADDPSHLADAQRQLVRIGIDRPQGGAVGDGPADWAPDHDRRGYEAVDFERVAKEPDATVLDVRRDDERESGAVKDSLHVPIDEILDRMHELPDETLWVHCASGFRASIASSLLDRAGKSVVLIDDEYDKAEELGLTG